MTDAHATAAGDEESTRRITSAPSPADEEKTQVVQQTSSGSTPDDAAEKTRVVPQTVSGPTLDDAADKTRVVGGSMPSTSPPAPAAPEHQRPVAPPHGGSGQSRSGPVSPGTRPPHGAAPGGFVPTPPPPSQTSTPPPPSWSPPSHSGPTAAPGPGQAPPRPGQPPYGGPLPPGGPVGPPYPPPPGAPHPPHGGTHYPPTASAQAFLEKGNSFIARLMHRGVRGELIRQPWFQNFRHQQPDQFVYVSYGVGLVLSLIFSLLPGLVSLVLSNAVWVGLAYLFFAVGTKRAHQFIVYGICLVGAVLSLLGALFSLSTIMTLAGLPYSGSAIVGLIIVAAGSVVVALILGYIGLQVHRGIQRMSSAQ